LDHRQVQALGLLPVARDIVEVFGIDADLLEQGPLRFDMREILFALIFPLAFFQQAVLAPDAFQARCEMGKSNSRISRRAPKVCSVLLSSTSCPSVAGGVFCG
jgi:hypothetical protein